MSLITTDQTIVIEVGTPGPVGPTGPLSTLTDVEITSATSGDFLTWNGTAWVNTPTPSASGYQQVQDEGVNLAQRTTIDFTGPGVTVTDDGSKTVVTVTASATALDDLTDVSTAGAANGQVLKFNGSSWAPGVASSVGALDDLTDVVISGVADKDVVSYNQANAQFENRTLAAAGIAASNHNHAGIYEPANSNIQAHIIDTANPHAVTKVQVGLGNVTNDAQLTVANNLSDLQSAGTARTNLGLGGAATLNVGTTAGTVAAGDHVHTGVYEPANANIQAHISSDTVHLTAGQNTLLDGLSATLTSAELNFVEGVTSAIQTQLDNKLDKTAGGTVAGDVTLNGAVTMGSTLTIQAPTLDLHAATKFYVDNAVIDCGTY